MLRKGVLICVLLIVALILGACGGPGVMPDATDKEAVSGETGRVSAADLSAETASPEKPAAPSVPEADRPTAADAESPAVPSPETAPSPKTAPPETPAAPQADPAPKPTTPQDTTTAADTCTLSVRCDTILANRADLNPEKAELVPANGVIFPAKTVGFQKGDSVFDVLQREMKRAAVHFEFVRTPAYDSAYIKGIHNLYEGDCGPLSGWTYLVNGALPNYGCSQYIVQPGDVIKIVYSCDLGRDVSGETGA